MSDDHVHQIDLFFRLRIIYCWSVSWPDNVITPIPGWCTLKLKSTTFTLPQIWRRELFVECKDELQCLMLESNVMDFGFLERMNTFGQRRVTSVEWKRRTHHPYDAKNVLKAKTCWTLPGSFMNELRTKLCVIFSSFSLCTSHRKGASAPAVRLLRAHLVWFWWVISNKDQFMCYKSLKKNVFLVTDFVIVL